MELHTLWSLRLGFTSAQAKQIATKGLKSFLNASYSAKVDQRVPDCLSDSPKTIRELMALRNEMKKMSESERQKIRRAERKRGIELISWWLNKLRNEKYPLREKMVCFWHNHFVASNNKIKNAYWLYQHNQTIREQAFGNFRELTRSLVKSNAVIRYLDNDDNKLGKFNENLSRELLELFTLGVGNYSEEDIKNGARALAGLSMGDHSGQYRLRRVDNTDKTYFGKTGNWKVDDIVDIIFEQKSAPYLITRKVLQWFIYDIPDERLVTYYGDYLRSVDFEIQPLLTKIFTEERAKKSKGQKIKDPLTFSLQLIHELQVEGISNLQLATFLKEQGMMLYGQPNVKGWGGGRSWLTAQIFMQRNEVVDTLCQGTALKGKGIRRARKGQSKNFNTKLEWNTNQNSKELIKSFCDRLLFQTNEELVKDMQSILDYDFDPKAESAEQGVMRLFNYICKTPEFQLI